MAFASFLSRGSMRMYARYAYRYQYEPDRRLVYSVVRKYPTENVCVPCRRQVYRYEIRDATTRTTRNRRNRLRSRSP